MRDGSSAVELSLASVAADGLPRLQEEIREQPSSELVEILDQNRLLLHGSLRSLFCLHRFPVQALLPVDDLQMDSVRPFLWDDRLRLEPLREQPFAIQLEANRRLPWSFSSLVDILLEDAALPGELFSPRRPQVVLSAYFHEGENGCRIFAGVSGVAENLSPWSSGRCRIPRDPDSVSRAEAKLLEAWEAFGLEGHSFGTRRALDLGAAPGGWSRVLAKLGFRVGAVDPAELDSRVLALPTVTHHRGTAGQFLSQERGQLDLLASDMKMEALMAADLLLRCAERLHPSHGRLLTTLKLGKGSGALKEARRALARLARGYEILASRQLYFNRSEITVLGRPLTPDRPKRVRT